MEFLHGTVLGIPLKIINFVFDSNCSYMKRIRLYCSHSITRCFIANYSLGVEDNADEATNTNVFAFPARRFEDFFASSFKA